MNDRSSGNLLRLKVPQVNFTVQRADYRYLTIWDKLRDLTRKSLTRMERDL